MNKYLAAVVAIAVFTAVLSIAFPRLAPIAVREIDRFILKTALFSSSFCVSALSGREKI